MPKNRKLENDSDTSDSGPEDREEPPVKKSKGASGNGDGPKSSRKLKNPDGESYWEIDKAKRVSVRNFRGKTYVDVREFYEKDGKILPGKKGIALNVQQWDLLKRVIHEIDDEIAGL